MLTFPKDTAQYSWTRHIKNKMVFYHISGAQILRIFRKPDRLEEGIAPSTVAAMKTKKAVGAKTPRAEEIWIMYRMGHGTSHIANSKNYLPNAIGHRRQSKIVFISTWRYPGVTKPGTRPDIPEDVLAELERLSHQ